MRQAVTSITSYIIDLRAVLVHGMFGRSAECLATTRVHAGVRLFPGVQPQMSLRVLQPGARLAAVLQLGTEVRLEF